jgi:hypothetical protein
MSELLNEEAILYLHLGEKDYGLKIGLMLYKFCISRNL